MGKKREDFGMVRSRKHKQTQLTEKKEKILPERPPCFRTECLLCSLLIGVLALFVTWGSSSIVNAGYELVQAREKLVQAQKQNELLRMETVLMKSPQRIRDIAVAQLGMTNPQAVYMAKSHPIKRKNEIEQAAETKTTHRVILFGSARAEAHNAEAH